ncbi:hypothetical protein X739_33490 [Mesorhizobium sp. LNHC220B00]|nr:hypothetical protein [Mesorhizobium sp. LNHC220B00]ESY76878.1 hypothetical protein X739_33490 [Mesorhizobium sp. LNHC220B00]
MKGKSKSVLVAVTALLAAAAVAPAQGYQFPPDPIAPTSQSECDAVYEQYSSIAQQLIARAKAAGDMAWEIVMQSGADSQSNSLYAEAGRLHDEVSEVQSQGSAARLRCMRQLYAYQANQAAEKRDGDIGRLGEPGHYAADLGGKVGSSSAKNGLKTLVTLPEVPAGLAALARASGKAIEIGGRISDLSGRGGAGGYLKQAVDGLDYLGQWGSLRSFMVKASLGELLNINKAATSSWQAEMSAFNEDSGLGRLVSDARQAENARFAGTAPSSGTDALADDELEAYRENRGMYVGRGKAYDEAVAEVQREYRKAMSRPAPRQPSQQSAGTRYPAWKCQQLQAQIQEYYRVLPQYDAAGQGAAIRMGIDGNQSEYDRGCR